MPLNRPLIDLHAQRDRLLELEKTARRAQRVANDAITNLQVAVEAARNVNDGLSEALTASADAVLAVDAAICKRIEQVAHPITSTPVEGITNAN